MKGLKTLWEEENIDKPEASNNYLIHLLFLKGAYENGEKEAAIETLADAVIEAHYCLLDIEKYYTYTRME